MVMKHREKRQVEGRIFRSGKREEDWKSRVEVGENHAAGIELKVFIWDFSLVSLDSLDSLDSLTKNDITCTRKYLLVLLVWTNLIEYIKYISIMMLDGALVEE